MSQIEILATSKFTKWIQKLKDLRGKARVLARIKRLEEGYFGDVKSISNDLFEMRFHFGPGYRVYYWHQRDHVILLLVGGTKQNQAQDIQSARDMIREWKDLV